jgi:outer membrane protein assembly factor BamB
VNIKRKLFLVILAIIVLSALIVTGCTKGISRGWAGGAVTPDGKMFVASMTGRIIAVDANSNAILGKPIQLSVQSSAGLLGCSASASPLIIYASPIVLNTTDPGTVVYIGGFSDGKIHGFLFKDGALVEKNPTFLSDQLKGQIVGGMIIDNDMIYFATSDGTVYALNSKDLSINWSHKINSKIWSAPTIDGNTLYIGCFNKTVYALNITDGSEKWTYEADGAISSTPVVNGNNVYIGDYDRHFYALDKTTGNLVWKFPAANAVDETPRNWFWAQPVVLNGVIYAPSLDGNVYALDITNGNMVNKYVLGDSISSSPVVIGSSIMIATSVASTDPKKQKGKFFIIDPSDKSHRELALPSNEDVNAPLFNYGSIVYVHTSKDNLYSIDTSVKEIKLTLLFNLTTVK